MRYLPTKVKLASQREEAEKIDKLSNAHVASSNGKPQNSKVLSCNCIITRNNGVPSQRGEQDIAQMAPGTVVRYSGARSSNI